MIAAGLKQNVEFQGQTLLTIHIKAFHLVNYKKYERKIKYERRADNKFFFNYKAG